MEGSAKRPKPNSEATGLISAEQCRLLESLGDGASLADAAARVQLSLRTAERRLAEARVTLGVSTNAQALLRIGGSRITARNAGLTRRERQVLVLVGEGLRDDEIANRLGIAPSTVAALLRSAMTKLDARTRIQAVVKLAGITDVSKRESK